LDFRDLLAKSKVCLRAAYTTDGRDARGLRYTVQYWLQDDESGMYRIHWIWKIKANTWDNTVTFLQEFPRVHRSWYQTDTKVEFGKAVYDSLRYTLTGNRPPEGMGKCIPVPVPSQDPRTALINAPEVVTTLTEV